MITGADWASKEVLIIGAGGIGVPAALVLAASGCRRIRVADDDDVAFSNLHRQVLYTEADLGQPKVAVMKRALEEQHQGLEVIAVTQRCIPATVADLVLGARVVIDASDNFATRFLLNDVVRGGQPQDPHRGDMPIVIHAAAIRWQATVMLNAPSGACYRCLFEAPPGAAPDCASAGVAPSVCAIAGAVAADWALQLLSKPDGEPALAGKLFRYDALRSMQRWTTVAPRSDCACGLA